MMWKSTTITFAVIAYVGGLVCSGRLYSAEPVEMPNGDSIPAQVETRRNGDAWLHWMAAHDFVPRCRWSLDAPEASGAPKLGFMEGLFVLSRYQAESVNAAAEPNNWCLVGNKKAGSRPQDLDVGTVFGWVPEKYLLSEIKSKRNLKSEIEYKILFVNDVGRIQRSDGTPYEPGIVLQAPFDGAAIRGTRAFYDVYYVFKFVPTELKPRFLLIGKHTEFRSTDSPEKIANTILGWVDVERTPISRWDTKQGIEWRVENTWPDVSPGSRRTAPGTVYHTIEESYAAVYPEMVAGRPIVPVPLYSEPFVPIKELEPKYIPFAAQRRFDTVRNQSSALVSRGYLPHYMRPPILDTAETAPESGSSDGSQQPPLLREYKAKRNQLLHIGAIGGKGGLSKDDLDDIRKEALQLAGEVKTVEILFLVDRTGSMNELAPLVSNTIAAISEDAVKRAQQNGGAVRAAVALYDDTEGRSDDPRPEDRIDVFPKVELSSVRAAETLAKKVSESPGIGGGKSGEMMFFSIKHAVERMKFDPFSRKLLIVISDEGDRSFREKVGETYPLEDTELDKLRDVLVPSQGTPVEVLAIQIDPGYVTDATRAFQRQLAVGLKRRAARWQEELGHPRALVGYEELGNKSAAHDMQAQILSIVSRYYGNLKEDAERLRAKLTAIATERTVTMREEKEIQRLMKQRGRPIEGLDGGGIQSFREGYLWKFPKGLERRPDGLHADATAQIRVSVLLNRVEIEEIQRVADKIANHAGDPVEGMRELLMSATGDKKFKSFHAWSKAKHGFEFRTKLMQIDVTDPDPEFRREDLEVLGHRASLLKDILDGVSREYSLEKKSIAGEELDTWVPGEKKAFKRFFKRFDDDTNEWCWVREDELP